MMDKIPVLPKDIRWHMIGHLQRNKVKYVVGQAALIHSVDTYRLAEEINIQAKKKGICMPVLIEVNIAGEASKFGVRPEDTLQLVKDISTLENVKIQGLMTVAPYVEDPEENRGCFRKIKDLSVDIAAQNIDNVSMNILSMGMTGDYMVAIEEGATMGACRHRYFWREKLPEKIGELFNMKAFDKLLDFMRLGDDEDYYDDEGTSSTMTRIFLKSRRTPPFIFLAPGTARRKKRTEPPRRRAL